MTVEDRIRAATRARVELVRDIRPLEVPERLPRRGLRVPRPRRLTGWLAPVTAAAVVVALAVALVSVRMVRNDAGLLGPATVPAASGVAFPRYYVWVSTGLSGAPPTVATVADSRTGAVLATVRPPAHRVFAGVTGAADDRTFVLDTVPAGGFNENSTHVWYRLRIAAGAGHPALTRLPIAGPPASAQIQGLALSPDGRTLAVLFQPLVPDASASSPASAAGAAPAPPVMLRTYSLATGRALRTWTTPAPRGLARIVPNPDNTAALSWAGDRALAFKYPVNTWPYDVRTLNTASKGSDFVTASKPVMAGPGDRHSCASLRIATDGRTVVCGTLGNATGGCVKEEPEFDQWSTATGKLTRVLYRYGGTCRAAGAAVLWAGPGGTVIGAIAVYSETGQQEHTAGLIWHGRFFPLRISFPPNAAAGALAF